MSTDVFEQATPPAAPITPTPPAGARHPLLAPMLVLLGITAAILALCLVKTGGTFIYPVDDVYIHLAIARSVADHGVWGVTHGDFSSAGSSLLWPLQLAALLKLFGPSEWLPLLLNLAYGVGTLALAYHLLRRQGMAADAMLRPLLLVVILPSLPHMVLLGMEHTMQGFFALLFACMAAVTYGEERQQRSIPWWLIAVALLSTFTRYEGAFMVLVVMTAALWRRRWLDALLLGVAGALPIVLFGLYAVANGEHFLPNPLLVKSDLKEADSLARLFVYLLGPKMTHANVMTPVTFLLLFALFGVLLDLLTERRLGSVDYLFTLIVTATCLLHLFGARTGWWLARYEAYLVLLATVATVLCWRGVGQRLQAVLPPSAPTLLPRLCLAGLFLVACMPFVLRLANSLAIDARCSKNIHDQQWQMGRFVQQYYDRDTVVLNDIGAVLWLSRIQPIDMAGLATHDIALAMRHKRFTSDYLTALAKERGARIAIVFKTEEWLPAPRPPRGWLDVGSWTISDNVMCGDATVYFVAFDEAAAQQLAANLRAFAPSLPGDVAYRDLWAER